MDPIPPAGEIQDDIRLPVEADPQLGADRQSRLRRWTEAPSWLVSFMLHVSLFLLLTSFLTPQGSSGPSGNRGGGGQILLTIGMSRADSATPGAIQASKEPSEQPTPGQNPATMPPQPRAEEREATTESKQQPSEQAPTESSASNKNTRKPQDSRVARREQSSGGARQSANRQATRRGRPGAGGPVRPRDNSFLANYERWIEQTIDEPTGAHGKVSKYSALLDRIRPSTTAVIHPGVRNLRPVTEIIDPKQQAYDKIVDDFIAYDIGRLHGSSGQRALNRFQALGSDAVPALVRGLNKAAGIHASCPVGVIAGKLMNTIHLSKDPTLRAYALEHIGVGVSEKAPHFQRLVAMRKSWLNGPGMPPQVVKVLEQMESGQDGELMELMLAISDAPSDTAIAAIDSGDNYLASAAALAALQGRANWPPEQRKRVGYALHRLASTTADAQLRSLAQEAHAALQR